MPSYLYRCKKCTHEFEISLSLKEKEEGGLKCVQCNATELQQILATSGVLKHGQTKSCDPSPSCQGCCGNCPDRS